MKSFIKKYLLSGALVLTPIALTLWILKALILWANDLFIDFIPVDWQSIRLFGYELPGVGLVLTLFLIFITGVLTQHFVGQKLLTAGDFILHRIPLGAGIYKSIKQLLNAFVTTGEKGFRQVVLIEWNKTHVIGFVTGESTEILQKYLKQPMVNVFVPTSPNPTTGILLVAPRERLIPIDIPPEKAFKFIVSGGTVSL